MTLASKKNTRHGFTLVELLVVIGIIAVLIGILMPALSKARAAANKTACLANTRSMGQAFAVYLSRSKGHLPYYNWHPGTADGAWSGYWVGLLSDLGVKTGSVLCPEARDPIAFDLNGSKGFGTVSQAWTGQFQSNATGVRYDSKNYSNLTNQPGGYRIGSYGFNRNINAEGKFGLNISKVRNTTEVPVFYDCTWVDNASMKNGSMVNGVMTNGPKAPTNLGGQDAAGTTGEDQLRFWIARHGRGINMAMADGSARWVPLEETYNLQWSPTWNRYVLPKGFLPNK